MVRAAIAAFLAAALGCVGCLPPGSRLPPCPARPVARVGFTSVVMPASVARIGGRVVWATDSTPVRHASLRLEIGDRYRNSVADSTGMFVVDSLTSGRYIILTRALGFEVRRDTVDLADGVARILLIPLIPLPPECW